MYMAQTQLKALRRYAAVDTNSRVEGASPHQLVRIIFDELLLSLDGAIAALRAGDRHKAFDKQTRALTMLHALESSLDFDNGGDVAPSLAMVYREARRRILEATATNTLEPIESARGFIADIAEAWNMIG